MATETDLITRPESPGFSGNKLFSGIKPEIVAELQLIPHRVDFEPDVVVFREGDPADCFFLIADGGVTISKRGRGGRQEVLSQFGSDEFFGEMAIYDPAPRSAQAATTGPTSLGRVDQAGLERMLALAPLEISANLTRESIRRLRNADSLLIAELLAAERLSLVGSMAAGIIHDFKNPITVILGAVQMIERRSDDATATKYAGMIRRSVDGMLSMAQELLDYSRGAASLQLQTVSVGDLLAELDEQALNLLAASGIKVERRIAYSGAITVDRSRFIRLLLNVVRNAAEAMAGGGTLQLEVDHSGDRVRIHIEDTGEGIPADMLPTIFQPFVTRGKSSGTGLGLAIAKSVVDAHGGNISISSTPGVGTRVLIELPVTQRS